MEKMFVLPNLGDGIEKGVVINVESSENAPFQEGDTLLEVETDKAVLPVPAPEPGTTLKLFVKENQEIKVGQNILSYSSQNTAKTPAPPPENNIPAETQKPALPTAKTQPIHPPKNPILPQHAPPYSTNVNAGPATRKLARELGINLSLVKGTKRGNRIDIVDVKNYAKSQLQNTLTNTSAAAPLSARKLPDFSTFGEIKIEKVSNLRKTIAKQMELSSSIPHVHQQQTIEINAIMEWRKKYAPDFKKAGSALSVTMFIIKALATCLKEFPIFNSSFDSANNTILYKKYYNIGVAVDTPQGLIVPVLKNVDKLSIFQIGVTLKDIAKKARERKLLPKDLKGASMTLSNLGGIGGSFFTPIINWPEVAIIGVSRNELRPAYSQDGQVYPQNLLPVTLGYDHRIIDGADAARFIMRFSQLVENPALLLTGL